MNTPPMDLADTHKRGHIQTEKGNIYDEQKNITAPIHHETTKIPWESEPESDSSSDYTDSDSDYYSDSDTTSDTPEVFITVFACGHRSLRHTCGTTPTSTDEWECIQVDNTCNDCQSKRPQNALEKTDTLLIHHRSVEFYDGSELESDSGSDSDPYFYPSSDSDDDPLP